MGDVASTMKALVDNVDAPPGIGTRIESVRNDYGNRWENRGYAVMVERSDWTLLAIGAGGGRELSPVQLQKSLFLLGKECADEVGDDFYAFQPYNYGPFDSTVYSDAEALEAEGLVSRIQAPGRSWAEYVATSEGLRRASGLRTYAPPRAVKYLDAVVAWSRQLTFDQLVRAVYQKYPETRARSIFRG